MAFVVLFLTIDLYRLSQGSPVSIGIVVAEAAFVLLVASLMRGLAYRITITADHLDVRFLLGRRVRIAFADISEIRLFRVRRGEHKRVFRVITDHLLRRVTVTDLIGGFDQLADTIHNRAPQAKRAPPTRLDALTYGVGLEDSG